MVYILALSLAWSILVLIILFSLITVEVQAAKYYSKKFDMLIKVKLFWGLIKISINTEKLIEMTVRTMNFWQHKAKEKVERTDDFLYEKVLKRITPLLSLDSIKKSYQLFKIALRPFAIRRLDWQTKIGVGDASKTAVISGALWAMKANIIGSLSRLMKINEKGIRLNVVQNYEHSDVSFYFNCIFSFRIGYIISASLKILFLFIYNWIKGGEMIVRSSNRSAYENSYGKH